MLFPFLKPVGLLKGQAKWDCNVWMFQVHKILDDKQRVEFVSFCIKHLTSRANPYFKTIYELLGTFTSHAPTSASEH